MRSAFVLLALAFLGSTFAHHLAECEPTTFDDPMLVTIDTVALGTYYAYDGREECHMGCLYNFWFYQESNGIDGLQRGDEGVDNTCHGTIESDTIIF